ncbi:hypothetical protein J2X76_004004 [Neorhizobium sp. 2083]|nr:hypothetical protein [Neorhizobium sp. 2083]
MKRNRESLSFRLHGFSKVLLRQSGCPDRKGGNEQEKPEPSYVYALRDRTRALKGKFGYDKSSPFRGALPSQQADGTQSRIQPGIAVSSAHAQNLVLSSFDGKVRTA